MKYLVQILVIIMVLACGPEHSGNNRVVQTVAPDTVSTTGIFDGVLINKYGYKINEFYISPTYISDEQRKKFPGKSVTVKGKLRTVQGSKEISIQSTQDVKLYIDNPVIVLME